MNMEANINLDFSRIQTPLLEVIKESNDNILFGLRVINEIEKLPDVRLEEQAADFKKSGIRIEIGEPIRDLTQQKEVFSSWLIKKGFEDLVKAINLCVIEAYYISQLYKLTGKTLLLAELEDEIKRIKKDSLDQANFPKLLDEKLNTGNMTYKEPAISINRVRNCLIHRNGIVTQEKDINDKINNVLKLIYYSLDLIRLDENGKETDRMENTNIGLMAKKKEKEFKVGEKIILTEQEFRGCLFTCHTFSIELTEIIKRNCV